MARRTITFITISCILLVLIAGESLSQTRRTRPTRPRRTATGTASGSSGWQATAPQDLPTPPPPPNEMMSQMQARQQEFQHQMQDMRRQARHNNMQTLKQTLNATDAEWQQLEPQLQRIERLKHEATVSLDLSCFGPANLTGGGGMGGFGGFGGAGGMTGGMGGGMMSAGQGGAPGGTGSFGASTSPRGTGGGMMGGGQDGAPGGMGGFGGMGMGPGGPQQQSFTFMKTFQTGRPSSYKNTDELTDGDVLCEELLDMLQDPAAPAPEITRRVQALRALRQQAARDLAVARGHLRANVNPKQEATLILLAYLD